MSAAGGFQPSISIQLPYIHLYLRDTNGKIMQDKNGDMYDFGDIQLKDRSTDRPIQPEL